MSALRHHHTAAPRPLRVRHRPLARCTLLAALLAGCADGVTEPRAAAPRARELMTGSWRPIVVDPAGLRAARLPSVPRAGGAAAALAAVPSSALGGNAGPEPDPGAVRRWNRTARGLVGSLRATPPRAARGYALLSVAQYDALVALRAPSLGNGPPPAAHRFAEQAAVAGASAEVLAALFPTAAERVGREARAELARYGDAQPRGRERLDAAYALGEAVGRRVVEHAASDGSDAVWDGVVPTGAGYWFSSATPAQPPLLPLWGRVRPWLMRSGDALRPAPPPAFGSPEFAAALAEVRRISDTRTPDQLRVAQYWADGPGSVTPPGHWNVIADDVLQRHHRSEVHAAWTLALLNMAMMDASIACWDAKYSYWLLRPSQADPAISTPIGLPNFPAYTSGHATFSGAAAELLGELFPSERRRLRALAEEAAVSRLYGGIHYRFDSDRGLEAGRALGRLAAARGRQLHGEE